MLIRQLKSLLVFKDEENELVQLLRPKGNIINSIHPQTEPKTKHDWLE